MDWTEYVRGAAQVLEVEIPAEYMPGVVDNFASIAQIAALVMVELPTAEAAAVFEPLNDSKNKGR